MRERRHGGGFPLATEAEPGELRQLTFLPGPLADEAARRGAVLRSLDPPLRPTIGLLDRRGSLSPAAAEFRRLTGERFAG